MNTITSRDTGFVSSMGYESEMLPLESASANLEQTNQQASQMGTHAVSEALAQATAQGVSSSVIPSVLPSPLQSQGAVLPSNAASFSSVAPLSGQLLPSQAFQATQQAYDAAGGMGMKEPPSLQSPPLKPKHGAKSSKLKELDILWSGTQQLFHHRDDAPKHPLLYFSSGFLAGVLVTLVVAFLFQSLFKQVIDGSQMLTTTPQQAVEKAVLSPNASQSSGVKALLEKPSLSHAVDSTRVPPDTSQTAHPVVANAPSVASNTVAPPAEQKKGLFGWMKPHTQEKPVIQTQPQPRKTYVVRQGDTLAGICLKVYKTAEPHVIDMVQKANGMTSPHQLQIDQTLILPTLAAKMQSSSLPPASPSGTMGVRSPQ